MSDLAARDSGNCRFLKLWFGDDPRANGNFPKSVWQGKPKEQAQVALFPE